MPQFKYQAIDARGVTRGGTLESVSRSMALETLQGQGLLPVSLSENDARAPARATGPRRSWRAALSRRQFHSRDILSLTQSLAALLRAGLTIDRALAITANLNRTQHARNALQDLGRGVRAGRTFADALLESSLPLPSYYVGMVQAGEAGGNLPQTMLRLSDLLRQQHEVRERIRSALIYPALLAGVVLVTVILLLTFVLPKFQTLFAEADAQLPWMTKAVLRVGNFVSGYWWLLLVLAVAGAVGLWMLLNTPRGRARFDTWLVRSRWTMGLPVAVDTARLLRTLSTLLASGVPIGGAMRIGRATLTNSCLQQALGEAAQRIKAGEGPSSALDAVKVFPPQVIHLARVGEETGRLEDMLAEAASILEVESSTRLDRLLSLLVPTLTILMGAMIATLIGSVLVGLLSVNELAF